MGKPSLGVTVQAGVTADVLLVGGLVCKSPKRHPPESAAQSLEKGQNSKGCAEQGAQKLMIPLKCHVSGKDECIAEVKARKICLVAQM